LGMVLIYLGSLLYRISEIHEIFERDF
jgi:hypothetical protein